MGKGGEWSKPGQNKTHQDGVQKSGLGMIGQLLGKAVRSGQNKKR